MKIPQINNNRSTIDFSILENIPEHVAIIMDGNGRWAKERALPRIAGHKEGIKAVSRVVRAANKANVKTLTLYTFSTENWMRPQSEVDYLMKLPKQFLHLYLPEINENNVRLDTIGDFAALPAHTQKVIQYAKEQTSNNDGLLVNFALNYGSRDEIIAAMKRMMHDVDDEQLEVETINEDVFSQYLYTDGLSDPDLLIRTSGEKRLSNFLLWQLAYSEFWFTDVLWPDFDEAIFYQALAEYQKRKRRYGGV